MNFTCILALFIMAFLVGLQNLYWYYNEDVLAYVSLSDERLDSSSIPAVGGFGR